MRDRDYELRRLIEQIAHIEAIGIVLAGAHKLGLPRQVIEPLERARAEVVTVRQQLINEVHALDKPSPRPARRRRGRTDRA